MEKPDAETQAFIDKAEIPENASVEEAYLHLRGVGMSDSDAEKWSQIVTRKMAA